MSAMSYNGAAIIAMCGEGCVAVASDLRFGVQNSTLACDFKKVFKIHDRLLLGLSGLATDAETLHKKFTMKHNLYRLREERDIRPSTFASLVSATLYEHRFGPFFCEPIVAGLEPEGTPFISGMDSLGAMEKSTDFMCAGTNTASLLGICESMYQPGLGPEELFELVSQCMLSGMNRDALAGWGAVVYVISQDKTIARTLKGRMD